MSDIFDLIGVKENTEQNSGSEEQVVEQQAPETTQEVPTTEAVQEQGEVQTQTTTTENPQEIELDDLKVQEYLTKRLGKEIDIEKLGKEEFVDDEIVKYKEFKSETGGSFDDFMKLQKDYSKVSQADLVREYLALKNPEFDADDINFQMEDLMPSEDDLERDVKKKQLELKKLHKEALSYFEKYKVEYKEKLVADKPQSFDVKAYEEKLVQEAQKSQQEYLQSLQNATNEVSKISIPYGETTFDVNVSDKNELVKFISEMPHWYNEKGEIIPSKVVEDGIKIKYFDKILSDYAAHVEALVTEKIAKERKNITIGTETNASKQTTSTTNANYLKELGYA